MYYFVRMMGIKLGKFNFNYFIRKALGFKNSDVQIAIDY